MVQDARGLNRLFCMCLWNITERLLLLLDTETLNTEMTHLHEPITEYY